MESAFNFKTLRPFPSDSKLKNQNWQACECEAWRKFTNSIEIASGKNAIYSLQTTTATKRTIVTHYARMSDAFNAFNIQKVAGKKIDDFYLIDYCNMMSSFQLPKHLYAYKQRPLFKGATLKNWQNTDSMISECLHNLNIKARDSSDIFVVFISRLAACMYTIFHVKRGIGYCRLNLCLK